MLEIPALPRFYRELLYLFVDLLDPSILLFDPVVEHHQIAFHPDALFPLSDKLVEPFQQLFVSSRF